ncbi:hypothetical protein ABIA69_004697 [Lysinibacillus parviboronicapiens]|uniref:Uncharacterized protein n=1 Tax=Lysinibacillus parviboronicapiens TaxID=436516 RepID=A0ABV2PRR3_9BACI
MIHTSLFKKTFTTFCCSALLISGVTLSATSIQASELTNEEEIYLNELGFNKESEVYKLLLAIEQLPPEEQDAEEIAKWLSNESGLTITAEGEYLNFGLVSGDESVEQLDVSEVQNPYIVSRSYSFTEIAACVGALGGLVPVTKILKINKVLKSLGGAAKVMEQVLTNYKYYRKNKGYSQSKALNQALEDFSVGSKLSSGSKQLLLDFFNINVIIGSCGPLISYNNDKQNLKNEDENYFFNENALKKFA